MLPRLLVTSALLCALSTLISREVRGADMNIPRPRIVTTSQPTTDNSHALPPYNATVIHNSGSLLLASQSTLLSAERDSKETIPPPSDELLIGNSITALYATHCCDDETLNSATQPPLSSAFLANVSADLHESSTMLAAKISYESHTQQLQSLPAGVQVDDLLTELLTLPVSSHDLTDNFPRMFQLSSTPVPDQEASSLSTQATAFHSTESEHSNRLDVTPSMLESITTEVSTSAYYGASSLADISELLEIPWADLAEKTHEHSSVDNRPSPSYETATFATDFMTALHKITSDSNVSKISVPETQLTILPSTQGEAASAVGLETTSPEGQATETNSTQYRKSESMTVTALTFETHASTKSDQPLASVAHRASTSATHNTELKTELDNSAADLDRVSLFMIPRTTEFPTNRYQKSYDVFATALPVQTRGSQFFNDLVTISSLTTPDGTTELATGRYPLLTRVITATDSHLNALATKSWNTHRELSTSGGLVTSLYERQQSPAIDGVEVMSLFETRDYDVSINQYVLPSRVSEATLTSTTSATESSSEHLPKLDPTGLFRQAQSTELPSKKEDYSSIYLSIMRTYRAPSQGLSTSTAASISSMTMQASDRGVIVTAAVVGSVVLLAIVCGGLLLLAYRAGKTGSFFLPKLHPSGTDVEMSDPFLHTGRNHMSPPLAKGCGNAAFV